MDNPAFWEELGKTVAMFGKLEESLISACYGLTKPPAEPSSLRPEQMQAHLEWYAKVEGFKTDAMGAATNRFLSLLKKDGRVPESVRDELRAQFDELRRWRNALCHGAWFRVSGDGAGALWHHYKENKQVVRFPPTVTSNDLAELRARILENMLRISEAASVTGYDTVVAAVFPRKFEPRNAPPERE